MSYHGLGSGPTNTGVVPSPDPFGPPADDSGYDDFGHRCPSESGYEPRLVQNHDGSWNHECRFIDPFDPRCHYVSPDDPWSRTCDALAPSDYGVSMTDILTGKPNFTQPPGPAPVYADTNTNASADDDLTGANPSAGRLPPITLATVSRGLPLWGWAVAAVATLAVFQALRPQHD